MTGAVPERLGSAHPNIAPYGTSYRCRDGGYVVLAVGTDSQFQEAVPLPGRRSSVGGPIDSPPTRPGCAIGEIWRPGCQDRIRQMDREALIVRLRAEAVPAGEVRDVGEALVDPLSAHLVLSAVGGASAVRTAAFGIDGRPASEPGSSPCLLGARPPGAEGPARIQRGAHRGGGSIGWRMGAGRGRNDMSDVVGLRVLTGGEAEPPGSLVGPAVSRQADLLRGTELCCACGRDGGRPGTGGTVLLREAG